MFPWTAAMIAMAVEIKMPMVDASPSMPSIRFMALIPRTSQAIMNSRPDQPRGMCQSKSRSSRG